MVRHIAMYYGMYNLACDHKFISWDAHDIDPGLRLGLLRDVLVDMKNPDAHAVFACRCVVPIGQLPSATYVLVLPPVETRKGGGGAIYLAAG